MAEDAYALFYAFGDFQPSSGAPAYQGRFVRDQGPLELIPSATRQIVLDVAAGDARYQGFSLVPERGPVDMIAWPAGRPCALTGAVGGLTRERALLTVSGPFAVVTGGTEAGRVPASFVADLRTGRVEPLARDLLTPRERASAAMLGGGVLVSGGARSDGSLVDNAERLVLESERKEFDRNVIALGTPRADHASVTLVSGDVLLVGGTGPGGTVLNSLQAIEPNGNVRSVGLAALATARRSARVLRLANGELMVVGGLDAAGAPVRSMEWLSPDATSAARPPRVIDIGVDQSAVALPAGGALIVTSVAPPLDGASVVIVTADGDLETATPIAGAVTRIALFSAAGGAPVLWTGSRWLRWRPWEGTFAPLSIDGVGPRGPAPVASGDPGLLLWSEGGVIVGVRVDARGPYSTDVRPLLRDDPGSLAPDRLVSSSAVSTIRFDAASGLSLPFGATAFVTDATFAGVDLGITMGDGPSPRVVFRTEQGDSTAIGDVLCPPPPGNPWTLKRRGARIEVRDQNGDGSTCDLRAIGSSRVSVGLRGAGPGVGFVRQLVVDRR